MAYLRGAERMSERIWRKTPLQGRDGSKEAAFEVQLWQGNGEAALPENLWPSAPEAEMKLQAEAFGTGSWSELRLWDDENAKAAGKCEWRRRCCGLKW
jgi:hypothetical protein